MELSIVSSGGKSSSSGAGKSSASSAAGKSTSSAGKSDRSSMSGALSAGPTSGANANAGAKGSTTSNGGGNNAQGGGKAAGTAASAAGSVMGGLTSAVNAARSEKSALSQSIGNQVSKTMGTGESSHPNAGVTAPNATPAQKDAYMSGYRNETNAGMTRTAFGVVPGVGTLAGEGVARTQTMSPAGMAPENAAAYSSGRTGAKDAGISSGARGLATGMASILGGPIAGALTNAVMGTMSYNMQRAANPQAFSGAAPQSMGPVGDNGIRDAAGNGNGGVSNGASTGTPSMTTALNDETYGGAPSDYSAAYNSYHSMNLGDLPSGKLR